MIDPSGAGGESGWGHMAKNKVKGGGARLRVEGSGVSGHRGQAYKSLNVWVTDPPNAPGDWPGDPKTTAEPRAAFSLEDFHC